MVRAASGTACRSVVVNAASTSMRDPYDCRMEDFGPETYGDRVADVYDEWYKPADTAAEVALLTELAQQGRALELGIGTGRVALALAANGVEVHGVDASAAMVERMQAEFEKHWRTALARG